MKKLFAIVVAGILAGCAVAPTLDSNAIQQVRASLNQDEGTMRVSAVAIWVPNSKEFKFEAVEPFVKGIVVVTEQSILF
jgi:hypothetical protein